MSAVFDVSQSPFDRLDATEIEFLQDATDIEYYAPGASVLTAGQPTEFLYIVLKGAIEERDGDELVIRARRGEHVAASLGNVADGKHAHAGDR